MAASGDITWTIFFALACLCLAALVLSFGSERFKRAFKWSNTAAGKLAIIVVGTFCLVYPIATYDTAGSTGVVWGTFTETIPAAIYETAQVLVLQIALDTWSDEVFQFVGTGLFGHAYFWLLTFYAIACPVALAMTAIDVVLNGLTGVAVKAITYKKSFKCRPIYVFYGLNDNTVTLACDLLEHVADDNAPPELQMPLLIFTNVTGEADASGESYEEQVREAASGVGDVVVTPMVLEDVPEHVSRRARRRCEIHYLVISNDSAMNVRATIRLTDTFTEELLGAELDRLGWDESMVGSDPAVSADTRDLAAHVHIWCTHETRNDDLIFDSLPHRGPSERIMGRLLRSREGRRHSRSRSVIARRLLPLELKVRSLFEVRLINEKQQVVWDALVEQPLTEVLEPIDLSAGAPPHQLLYVVVVGLCEEGIEAIRAAFWYGRLPGVELRILGVGADAEGALRRLAAQAPGMLAERTPVGIAVGQAGCEDVPDIPADAETLPTVRLVEADTDSIDVERLFDGETVDGLTLGVRQARRGWRDMSEAVDASAVETVATRIPDDARIYTIVALETDNESIDVSLRIQRTLTERALDGRLEDATLVPDRARHENPVVTCLLLDEELYDSVGHLADGEEEFPVIPFGATYRTFSYESVLAAPWERAALNLQAAHDSAFNISRGTREKVTLAEAMESYNSLEVRKLSNRAAVRYAIYRLWCLGLDHGTGTGNELHDLWLERLGARGVIEGAYAGEPQAFECLCGISFKDQGMDEASRDRRVARALAVTADVRRRWPVLSALADQEHRRWCAFFRAQGWDTMDDFDDLARTMEAVGRNEVASWPYPHQSTRLKRHYYLKDDNLVAARRGAECRDDPCADDRLIVLETIRSLRGDVVG